MYANNLNPTSTDMMVNMLGNTDKLISSSKRVFYDKNIKQPNDDLDVNPDEFIKNDKPMPQPTMFQKIEHINEPIIEEQKYNETATETVEVNKKLNKKELMLQKLNMLRKLGELKQYGVQLTQNYNLNSDYEMMEYEYNLHHDIRSKQNSVQWMSHMMIGFIKGTEMVNDSYNPFDIKFEGRLSDKISSDMQSYYAVLGDIYEKYNRPGKQWAPEMRLLFMICGAALGTQMNRVMPGLGGLENMVKSPNTIDELRKKAAADTKSTGGDFVKKQHDAATQKAMDLKMIQDKELEMKRMSKILDASPDEIKTIQEKLILSSEMPPKISTIKEPQLNVLRDVAKTQSNIFRNDNKTNLTQQNKQLDDMLASLDGKHNDTLSSLSVSSKKSTISINKKIGSIMKKTKPAEIIFDKEIQDLLNNSDINKDEITIGSKSKNSNNYADLGISIGSSIKGKKIKISTS